MRRLEKKDDTPAAEVGKYSSLNLPIHNSVSAQSQESESSQYTTDNIIDTDNDLQSSFINNDDDDGMNEVTEGIETMMFHSYDKNDENINDSYDAANSNHSQSQPESESHNLNYEKPYNIIRGSLHQGNNKYGLSVGKQCTAMAASAIAVASFVPIENWKSEIIDMVLDIGNNQYEISMALRPDPPVENGPDDQDFLEVSEVHKEVYLHDNFSCFFRITNTFYGRCLNSDDPEFMSLEQRLEMLVESNFCAILTMNRASVAIIFRNGLYYLFDSHSRDESGKRCCSDKGKSCVCCFNNLTELIIMILSNMYVCEGNTHGQTNIYLLATIEVNSFKANDQIIDMNELSADESYQAFYSYLQNVCVELPNESADQTSENNEPRDAAKNTPQNCESTNDNGKRPSSQFDDTEELSSNQKKKKRRRFQPRSAQVSKSHKKLIINNEYVNKELNESFYVHRLASHNNKCRSLECRPNFIGPIMNGLQCTLLYECSVCEFDFIILSEPVSDDIARTNDSILLGCISSGIGFYQLEGLFTAADLPCHNYESYTVAEMVVGSYIIKTALQSMADAAKESYRLACEQERVGEDNIAYTTVITDGTYQKRSYASGLYNSSSGAAVIVDQFINKVIDVGVANKRCSQCQFGKKPYHVCYQNYSPDQSSTKMESLILLELFQTSVEKYNLRYEYIVSDGDSSVPQILRDYNVYGNYGVVITMIACMNHMLRRLSTNLNNFIKSGAIARNKKLKKVAEEAGYRSAKAIRTAARHLMSTDNSYQTNVKIMQEDLENMPFHAFGEHRNCKDYYCDKKPETNCVAELISLNVWNAIVGYYGRCIAVPGDALSNLNNNPVECVNNVIATKIGGKRIDFCKLGGYTIRVALAVVQYNSKTAMCDTFTTWGKCTPERLIALEKKRKEKVEYNNRRYHEKGSQSRYHKKGSGTQDSYYGPKAGIPVSAEKYEELLNRHKEKLQQLQNDRVKLERETIDQAQSTTWHTTRRLLITASKFKDACKSRTDNTKKNVVKTILYSGQFNNNPAVIYGKNNEANALDRLEEHLNITIEPCGLFIDDTILGFGATPDGLVGDDTIVEIKCPYSLKDTTPEEAIKKGLKWGNDHFKDKDPSSLRTSSPYYYQVQGQLHITKRKICILSIWTPTASLNLKIKYDETFWSKEMYPRLNTFYWDYLVPEIINPILLYGSSESKQKTGQSEKPPTTINEEVNEPLQQFFYGEKQVNQCYSLTPIVRRREAQTINNDGNTSNQNSSNDNLNINADDDCDNENDGFIIESEDEYYNDFDYDGFDSSYENDDY